MTNDTDKLIEEFTKEAVYLGEFENKEARHIGAQSQLAAATLRSFRDTLIAIARNQGPIPSHQAQDVLTEVGYCGHFNQIYRAGPGRNASGGRWVCPECDLLDKNRMVPFA